MTTKRKFESQENAGNPEKEKEKEQAKKIITIQFTLQVQWQTLRTDFRGQSKGLTKYAYHISILTGSRQPWMIRSFNSSRKANSQENRKHTPYLFRILS